MRAQNAGFSAPYSISEDHPLSWIQLGRNWRGVFKASLLCVFSCGPPLFTRLAWASSQRGGLKVFRLFHSLIQKAAFWMRLQKKAFQQWRQELPISEGLVSEVTQRPFHCFQLVKMSPKASTDSKSREIGSTCWWESSKECASIFLIHLTVTWQWRPHLRSSCVTIFWTFFHGPGSSLKPEITGLSETLT